MAGEVESTELSSLGGVSFARRFPKNYNNECLNQLSRANFAFATTSHVNMEVALYKVEEWEPPADWVDRGRRVGSSRRRSRGRGRSRRQRRRKSKEEEEREEGEGEKEEEEEEEEEKKDETVAAVAEEPEGFMNPRCGGLDRLCCISVFEEDGNGLQITVKVAPAARLD
ncbi:hypothetical protein ALC56_07303 [Trachymyrmex septentrionalis]|uniref:Uncharacterized protein n=1 Tax=Trachymyrmex septentrionalis TaxID=34720 RepID=A0A195FCX8_9HYME|nr:hypothetical protein ALC56_07303 [Trachymyrmex septentrionalis]